MYQSFGKSGYLNGKYFFATFVQFFTFWYKRMGFDGTCQYRFTWIDKFCSDMYGFFIGIMSYVCRKSGVRSSFVADAFYIYFTDNQLLFYRKTLAFGYECTILINKSLTVKYDIGC